MLAMSHSSYAATFNPGDSRTLSFSSLPYIGIANIASMDVEVG